MERKIYFNSNKENVVNLAEYKHATLKDVFDSFNYLYKDRKDTVGFEYKDTSLEAERKRYISKLLKRIKGV